jgi:hypothetical protein
MFGLPGGGRRVDLHTAPSLLWCAGYDKRAEHTPVGVEGTSAEWGRGHPDLGLGLALGHSFESQERNLVNAWRFHDATTDPFIQAVYEVDIPTYYRGPLCLPVMLTRSLAATAVEAR